ncbi:MAG: NIPSNAP family containing protein [Bacteroidetes bacterium]|nr:MAG: NIPSNAP family containing protein [Bacteroidota bacterium]
MKRRNFLKNTGAASLLALAPASALRGHSPAPKKGPQYYELRTYDLLSAQSQASLDAYLQNALIPALKRLGAGPIGAYVDQEPGETPHLYLLITYPKLKQFGQVPAQLAKDPAYLAASQAYHALPKDQMVYSRFRSSLLQAFDGLPQLINPPADHQIRELRIYESYSEDAHRRKVMMFDKEELDLFYKTGLHPVFFGKALIGDRLPNLTYMLTFKDRQERDANWQTFVKHPEWDVMKNKAEYADSVSKVSNYFLTPLPYSDI